MNAKAKLLCIPIFLFACILVVSCVKEDGIKKDNNEIRDDASYDITIIKASGDTIRLIGENIDSNWDPSLLFVYCEADQVNLPTGSLSLNIAPPAQSKALVESGSLTSADALVGTGEELNARLYLIPEGETRMLVNVVVGGNYISADIENMVMVDANSDEEVIVSGSFVAVSK